VAGDQAAPHEDEMVHEQGGMHEIALGAERANVPDSAHLTGGRFDCPVFGRRRRDLGAIRGRVGCVKFVRGGLSSGYIVDD